MVIEYSVLLGYAVGYIADTETYVIYSLMMFGETAQSVANSLFDLHPHQLFMNKVNTKVTIN